MHEAVAIAGQGRQRRRETYEEIVKHVREHAHTKRKQQSVNINWNNHSQS